MVLDVLLVVLVCLFCHCRITAYVGDNKLILILSYLIYEGRQRITLCFG